jgi:hypothetical protein
MHDRVSYLGSVSWSDEDVTALVLARVGWQRLLLRRGLQIAGVAMPEQSPVVASAL